MPRINDPALIRPVLQRDPAWSLYALADLAPEHAPHTEWYAPDDSARCAVLLYRGFSFTIFLDSGDFDATAQTLTDLAQEQSFYVSTRGPTLKLLADAGFEIAQPKPMLRMRLDVGRFERSAASAVRLTPADLPRLKRLYADGDERNESPEFFLDSMLDSGVYFGVEVEGELAAAAGTHVVAADEDVAGVGNIYTRHDLRRRGHARVAAAAVLGELVDRGIGTICLNVSVDNLGAIALYRAIGFDVHCEYFEGEAARA